MRCPSNFTHRNFKEKDFFENSSENFVRKVWLIKLLNDNQRQIVEHQKGALLVLAPVGTGKTLVLAERAANAIREGIDPNRILCMTFTNRAAKEMSERIRRLYPQDAEKITVSTFHALCASILRMEANDIGLSRDFVVYDEVDISDLIQEIELKNLQVSLKIFNKTQLLFRSQTYANDNNLDWATKCWADKNSFCVW